MIEKISFTLNDKPVTLEVDGNRKLLWVLRTELGLTGTKYGCGEGLCGACTVLINNQPALACQTDIKTIKKAKVLTIEGLEKGGKLHPLQKAFMKHDALQCGFCTPGMIMKSHYLLSQNPNPSKQDIAKSLEGNLCRCGAHPRIIDAVLTAAEEMKGGGRS
ncbi:MAG: 2Fe-2S ferredoxin, related to 4-hydroxybenzoyl-CoA reductase [Acidobacteria bacterium]|nr:2Fe-2S ferredoxin, related to 4-hydroxybenzoyl-CoA reductase [Acidobacteriota bacterium]